MGWQNFPTQLDSLLLQRPQSLSGHRLDQGEDGLELIPSSLSQSVTPPIRTGN